MATTATPAIADRLLFGALVLLAACTGDSGRRGPRGGDPATPTEVDPREEAPALVVSIVRLEGAGGPGGSFRPGDRPALVFDVLHADGSPWRLEELASGEALISGPTFAYQRVLPLRDDVLQRATRLRPGRYRYLFDALPAVYAPPYNDTPAFGAGDGELAGQPLLAGTYTVGLSLAWEYTVVGEPFLQVGEATSDFLLGGGAGSLRPRAATDAANCDRCHVRLEAHGGRYRSLGLCLLCHTSGAEDANDPALAGGTPGVTVDSRVLFHRIHNASRLPSVLGVGVNPDGTRRYDVPPEPYLVAGSDGEVHDYTSVGFPVWPNRTIPMPRDLGYSALGPLEKLLEDRTATGITSCHVCHGDPDGGGPLGAPAEGELHWREPSRRACGACHDDVDWDLPYIGATGQEMPPQTDDATCNVCHESTFGGPLSVTDGHRHPLRNPDYDPGYAFGLEEVLEAGASDGDGRPEPGEGVAVRLSLRDGTGAARDVAELDEVRAVLSGPMENAQLVLDSRLPIGLFAGPAPWTVPLVETVHLELAGTSSAAAGESFATARAPHVALPGGETRVLVRTGSGAATVLAAAAVPPVGFVDVADPSGFARDDHVVLDDGVAGVAEVLRVQHVEGDRLWLSSPAAPDYPPGPLRPHAAGASVVQAVVEPKVEGVDYALDAAAGRIDELVELGVGADVIVTYATPFVLPDRHGLALHDSPELDETSGKWTGKALVPGTYRVTVSGWADEPYPFGLESDAYRLTALPAARELLVGEGAVLAPYGLIESSESCNACHQDLRYHDGTWRGFDACLACHGTAGAEDRPRYVAGQAPATPGTRVDFRFLLHRLHRGVTLADPGFFTVSDGPQPYPLDFGLHFYAEIHFPALPGGTRRCAVCHGEASTAWLAPAPRAHPTEQGAPIATWTPVCLACHDAPSAAAHAASQVFGGVEACEVCHGPGAAFDVETAHRPR